LIDYISDDGCDCSVSTLTEKCIYIKNMRGQR